MKKTSAKILVVDDDPEIVEILKYNLSNSGFEVKVAYNGIQAVKKSKKFKPDIILMDVMMPEMNGIEACTEIRNIDNLKNVQIIFLSARGEDYTQIAAFDAGADDYINKPIKPRILLKKITNIAKRLNSFENGKTFIKVSDLKINREEYLVTRNKTEIILPRKIPNLIQYCFGLDSKLTKNNDIIRTYIETQFTKGLIENFLLAKRIFRVK